MRSVPCPNTIHMYVGCTILPSLRKMKSLAPYVEQISLLLNTGDAGTRLGLALGVAAVFWIIEAGCRQGEHFNREICLTSVR